MSEAVPDTMVEAAFGLDAGDLFDAMRCRKCGKTKGEAGWAPAAWQDRKNGACRDCKSAQSKKYWAKNSAKVLAKAKEKKKRRPAVAAAPATLDSLMQRWGPSTAAVETPAERMLQQLLTRQHEIILLLIKEMK